MPGKIDFVEPSKPASKPCACGTIIEPEYAEPKWWSFLGREKLFSGTGEWTVLTLCPDCIRKERERNADKAIVAEAEALAYLARADKSRFAYLIDNSGFAPREIDIITKPWIGSETMKAPFHAWSDGTNSLYIYGMPGTGKTHAAVVSLYRFIDKHREQGKFYVVADMIRQLRRAVKNHRADEMIDEIIHAPALVLDDIAVERPTGFVLEALQSIVDTRSRYKARMIITSNLSLAELAEKLDDRIASRLADVTMCNVIHFTGEDKRLRVL